MKKPKGRPQVFNITVRSDDPEALMRAVHQYLRKADRHGVVNVFLNGKDAPALKDEEASLLN